MGTAMSPPPGGHGGTGLCLALQALLPVGPPPRAKEWRRGLAAGGRTGHLAGAWLATRQQPLATRESMLTPPPCQPRTRARGESSKGGGRRHL